MTALAKKVLESHQRVIDTMQYGAKWKQDLALWAFFNDVRRYDEVSANYVQEFNVDRFNPRLQEVWDDFYEWEANVYRHSHRL